MGAQALTAASVAAATGGRLVAGDGTRVFTGASIDSRTIAPGELFFAIVAGRDGHAFVADAVARGAAGVVASREVDAGAAVVIQVGDTTRALQDLGRHVRRESGATVAAITGSAGKTTTKEAMAEVLSARYRVVKNPGNLNNHLGLPLSLLELRHGADVAVMELGMNHAGEIRVLVGLAEPEVRVWTNVGEAHIGYFGSSEAIAEAKAEILEQAAPDHLLVANADDARVMARVPRFPGRVVTFGTGAAAEVRAVSVRDRALDGTDAVARTRAGDVAFHLALPGRGNLANALAAIAVGVELDVPIAAMPDRLAALKPAPHRGDVRRLARGITVFDDSYNSSPSALAATLDVVARDTVARRKAAVLGEMLELGERATDLHRSSGRAAAAAGLARLVAVGGEPAKLLAEAAVEAGMPASAVTWVESSEEAAAEMLAWLQPGDLVLVKGSRGIRTDRVVERLAAELG